MTPREMSETHAAAFPGSRGWSAEEFATLLAQNGCFSVGDAYSFALVRVVADEAELLTIATHPDHRRQGLARAVMATWQAEAAQRGAVRAFLEVAADNTAAIALYKSYGYARQAARPGYYSREGMAPVDAVLMAADLTGRTGNRQSAPLPPQN